MLPGKYDARRPECGRANTASTIHRDLEENPRLKQMYADWSLENRALKDVIAKNWS
jgi:hypothetical protein